LTGGGSPFEILALMATSGEALLVATLQFLLPEQTLLLLVSLVCTISFSRGSKTLAGAKSVQTISQQKGDQAVKGNQSVDEGLVINLSPKEKLVKEWA
jgi:hypothetical protein